MSRLSIPTIVFVPAAFLSPGPLSSSSPRGSASQRRINMSDVIEVVRRPIITEKSTLLRESNRYVVEVEPWANKDQIRAAIEARFKVNVIGVRTIILPGKYRRK